MVASMQFYEFKIAYMALFSIECSYAVTKILDSVGAISQLHCSLERPSTVHMYSGCWPTSRKSCVPGLMFGVKNNSSTRRNVTLISCVKTPEATITANSNGEFILTFDLKFI